MIRRPLSTRSAAAALLVLAPITAAALEPPTAEQLDRYRRDGTLQSRIEAARALGNHLVAPQLAAGPVGVRGRGKAAPSTQGLLPADGAPRILTLLIAFEDMPGSTDPAVVDDRVFGDGDPILFPYESVAAFYHRSSYGRLQIAGSTLGWYTTPYPRSQVVESRTGRENLIKEALNHYDTEGHDFSQYDNDGDGVIDYMVVIWTGPHDDWAEFWWGYKTNFSDHAFRVDGTGLGSYSWQWENYEWPGEFTPEVVIHETGHALGLPDYYDYDDSVGPDGGVGGLDQMDANIGDHNAFSKWLLGWLEPAIFNQGADTMVLSPTDQVPSAAVFMHGEPVTDPYAEYFLVQVRRPEGNDAEMPNRGVLIWHVDARTNAGGVFLYDNSYTDHKLLRLMEADGLEEIEQGGRADAGDFYSTHDHFGTTTFPSSNRYDGVPTNVEIQDISLSWAGPDMMLTFDLGSGCALWCDASVTPNAWPGLPVSFHGSLATANCDGTPSYGWLFGDGAGSDDTDASHAFVSAGRYEWSVTARLEDAVCAHRGSILVCTGLPCWRWEPTSAMAGARSGHAAAALDDGRVLVVGGGADPEVYDPRTGAWSPTAAPLGAFSAPRAVRLADGRILVVGGGSAGSDDAEIYDPATDRWSVIGQLNHGRTYHSAIALADGGVLVAGGVSPGYPHDAVEAVEVFDPATGTWSVAGSLAGARVMPGLATLHDGRVVIVGGREAAVFDPVFGSLTRATALPAEWQQPVAVTLADGRVLMTAIAGDGITLLWDPATGRLAIAGRPAVSRQGASATRLRDGFVLVAGGIDGSGRPLDSTELFDPGTLQWSMGAALVTGRGSHAAVTTIDGRVMLTGGIRYGSDLRDVEILSRPTSPPREIGGRATP